MGIVSIDDLRREARGSARDVMTPLERLTVTTPDTDIVDALRALGHVGASDLAVVVNGMLVGMLSERDIARWLELRAGSDRPVRPSRHSHA